MRYCSPWKDAVITITTSTTVSAEVNLEANYEFLTVICPALTSATVNIHISDNPSGTFAPLHALDDDATGSFLHASTAGVGAMAFVFRIGGVQHIKVVAGAAQAANRTFKVRGFN